MPPINLHALYDHEPVSWPVQSFTVDHDFKSPSPAYLLLDRANAAFDLFYHVAAGVGVMAQLPDNEPVYFEVSGTRAACSRPSQTCKKVCVLMQHSQIDLEFATSDHAGDFLQSLGRLATKVGNLNFEIFEAQSLSALNRADYSIEKMCDISEASQAWMGSLDTDTFDLAK
jgi:histone acetyltransferase HTATIP